MNWNALKNNRCPKCNGDLANTERIETSSGPGLKCVRQRSPNILCGFTISDRKFEAIVADKVSKEMLYEDAEVLDGGSLI